ncbi:hypothetical protein BGZ68_005494 [Mortierella alpina]|nr:hypothetical protein BGZ68_005494 [Mortierella alpina]
MTSPRKIQARRAFLERYGNGPRSYFRREGAVVLIVLTVMIIAAGSVALANVSLSIGYLFLLLFIALTIAGIGTYFTYHYKVTQARRTMATVSDLEVGYNNPFDRHFEPTWSESVYVPPPPVALVSNRSPAS